MAGVVSPMERACGERKERKEKKEAARIQAEREKKEQSKLLFAPRVLSFSFFFLAGNIILLITQHAGCDAKSNANSCGEN